MIEKARNPSMAILITHFGLCALAAWSVDSLISRISWRKNIIRILIILAGLILAVTTGMAVAGAFKTDSRIQITALACLAVAWILKMGDEGTLSPRKLAGFCILVAFLEAGHNAGYASTSRLKPDATRFLGFMAEYSDLLEFLRRQPQPVRIDYDRAVIPFNFGDWHGVETYNGYLAGMTANLQRMEFGGERVRDLFGVQFTIGRNPAGPHQEEVFRGISGLAVFRNRNAFPRAWTVHRAERVPTPEDLREYQRDSKFDLRHKAVLTGPAPALESCLGEDHIQLLFRRPDRSRLAAALGCRGMLVMSDVWYPGWEASVDGNPVQIIEVYGALRGVVLEGGTHIVEFRYRPRALYLGAWLSAGGLLLALGAAIPRRKPVR
jgi:hypothetical protein